jgi:hypothetical protein
MTTTAEQDFTEGETQPEPCCDLNQPHRDLIVGAMKREGCSGRNLLVITTGQPLPSESRTPEERAAFEQLYRASRKRMEAEHRHVTAPRTASHVRHASPRARTSRRRPHSATQRASARSGDSGDGPGEPAPGDLAAPCCCEQCGAELLEPAQLCGLCKEEAALAKPNARVCAHPQCDVVLTGKSTQKTCDGPDGPHKRWLSRKSASFASGPNTPAARTAVGCGSLTSISGCIPVPLAAVSSGLDVRS